MFYTMNKYVLYNDLKYLWCTIYPICLYIQCKLHSMLVIHVFGIYT